MRNAQFALGALAFSGVLAWAGMQPSGAAPDKTRADLEARFTTVVRPFMQGYCVSCHGKVKPQAQLDLTAYPTMDAVAKDFNHWTLLMERLTERTMPPAGVKMPPQAQVAKVISWIKDARAYEISRNAGDPGPVTSRRLSNMEYDYTVRDLTGVDLHPSKEFPVDPANQEGFDNSSESLTLSPALIKKYMAAARDIADRAALTSTGIEFASHPVLAETDRDKFCILRIVDFYKKQPTDLADYFRAANHYKHRAELGSPNATLKDFAVRAKVSPGYLDLIWKTLNTPGKPVGPVGTMQKLFAELPAPDKSVDGPEHSGCVDLRDWALALRKKLAWKFPNLRVPNGFSDGGQCFVLWKDREYATHRRSVNPAGLQIGGATASHTIPKRGNQPARVVKDTPDPDLFIPEDEAQRKPFTDSFDLFCSVVPDAFYISERGRMFVDDPGDKGRLLTAGLHNSMGYFRDDQPLMELILDEAGRAKLDHMWMDFNQVAFVPERMHTEFFHYERAESATITSEEFNFVRSEDPDACSDAKIFRLADAYKAKAVRNGGGEPDSLKAIDEHFKWVSHTIRSTEKGRIAAQPIHLKTLVEFAQRAFRRPLSADERAGILNFYQTLRKKEGLSHEEAIRDSLASILISPKFLFHVTADGDTASNSTGSGFRTASYAPPLRTQNLSEYALANRLSYFLWSSMPDAELMAHAAAGDLHKPEVLVAQAHRMLKDARVRALALEFGGNWLDFRRFEQHNAVDRNRFPVFTDDLRQAMFEEPVHYLVDTFQNNRSVLDILYGRHTFVNSLLARHYGMPMSPEEGKWVRVDNADQYGRGGLLPMALFLTENSPGLRTSPVKRGYWVVRRVLGEVIPAPPPNVPVLPTDESKLGKLTLRQALVEHRNNPACAGCHARFDSYGLVFEGYGPVGEIRTRDLGGKPVDASAPFPGSPDRTGVAGLRDYLKEKRQKDFVNTCCRKLLSYGLGRTLLASDDPTLEQMQQKLASGGYRFEPMVDAIVLSKQFRTKRAPANLAVR